LFGFFEQFRGIFIESRLNCIAKFDSKREIAEMKLVGVLLVLVMLGSVVSSALAVSTEQKSPMCLSCSKVTTGKPKVMVVEINSIE